MKKITCLLLGIALLLCALTALADSAVNRAGDVSLLLSMDEKFDEGLSAYIGAISSSGDDDEEDDWEDDSDVPERVEAYINEADGHFIVHIPSEVTGSGEWVAGGDESESYSFDGDDGLNAEGAAADANGGSEQSEAVLKLVSELTGEDGYTADYEPVADGETYVQLRHYSGPVCDAMLGYSLSVVNGSVQGPEYGFWTDTSDAADWDEYVCGDWVMEEYAGNTMHIEKRSDGGWDVRIIATLDDETDGFMMSMYYDCDQELFAYDNGTIGFVREGATGENELEAAFATGIPGTFTAMFDEEGGVSLTWRFDAMPGDAFRFVRVQ